MWLTKKYSSSTKTYGPRKVTIIWFDITNNDTEKASILFELIGLRKQLTRNEIIFCLDFRVGGFVVEGFPLFLKHGNTLPRAGAFTLFILTAFEPLREAPSSGFVNVPPFSEHHASEKAPYIK